MSVSYILTELSIPISEVIEMICLSCRSPYNHLRSAALAAAGITPGFAALPPESLVILIRQ